MIEKSFSWSDSPIGAVDYVRKVLNFYQSYTSSPPQFRLIGRFRKPRSSGGAKAQYKMRLPYRSPTLGELHLGFGS
jgi:hypothetical protein